MDSPFGKRLHLLPALGPPSCANLHQRQNRPRKLPAACCKVTDLLQQASSSCSSCTCALPNVHAAFLLQHKMNAAQVTQGNEVPAKIFFPWRTTLQEVVAGATWPTKTTNGCRRSRLCIFTWFLVRFCKRNINGTLMAAITIMNVTAGTSSWEHVVGFIFSVDGVRWLWAVAVTVFFFSWGFYYQ